MYGAKTALEMLPEKQPSFDLFAPEANAEQAKKALSPDDRIPFSSLDPFESPLITTSVLRRIEMEKKQALVCGAGGFIGSHLVRRLKKEGF